MSSNSPRPKFDLPIGARYGRLVVMGAAERSGTNRASTCRCDCGAVIRARNDRLRSGKTASCSCESRIGRLPTHGHTVGRSESPEWSTWRSMKKRCADQAHDSYPRYGGRGITICPRWMDSFENFLADMGPKPSPRHQVDRIDPAGNYEPGNCRWVTPAENMRARRSTKLTPQCVQEIRGRREHGEGVKSIAARFAVTDSLVYQIVANKIWKEQR